MLVIVLNGPINSGKSTTGRALASILANAQFVEGDDHDAPEDASLDVIIATSLRRLTTIIGSTTADVLVIANPLRQEDYQVLLQAVEARSADLRVVTLSPPVEIALTNRGNRVLETWEIERSREMYAEGYNARAFSDLTITEMTSPSQTAREIVDRLHLSARQ
ncbi:nucleoside/nucleotide kinase family protein [Devosia epidermidihirudinis]|uniref:shikimate kinase n=1 Tax=Devosia epidermidihirudinis TaxID=1293439 RepID=UPI000A89461D|nr:shikimate kinase [Devosia epidermidihirudinis]